MLTHCQQFFNSFSASATPTWQTAWAAWRTSRPLRLARIRRLRQAACRTPRRTWWTPRVGSSIRRHQRHVLALAATKHVAACIGRTPLALRFINDNTSTRLSPPHVLVLAAAYVYAPGVCRSTAPPEHRAGYAWCPVFWGDVPPCFGETCPRVLGRRAPCFGETCPRVLGRRAPCFGETRPRVLGRRAPCFGETIITTSHCYRKDCSYWTFKKTLRGLHTQPRVCEA